MTFLILMDSQSRGLLITCAAREGWIPNPDPNAAPGDMIPTHPFSFGAKSQMRLKAATMILRYYETVEREITAPNMR